MDTASRTIKFPLISDERWAGSTLLQSLLGLVDVSTDCAVWMPYTSVLPWIGSGLLWTYAADAVAIGVRTTGGGRDMPGHPRVPALDWHAFARDLRLAHERCDNILVHGLEGCVEQRFLSCLIDFDWERTASQHHQLFILPRLVALFSESSSEAVCIPGVRSPLGDDLADPPPDAS
jgi:hypothetical protein